MTNQDKQPINNRYSFAGGTKSLPSLTPAGVSFAANHSRLLNFIVFTFESSALWSMKAMSSDESETRFRLTKKVSRGVVDFVSGLESHDALISEFILTRIVDEFLCYISDLLALIYKVRPEMMKSSEQERIDFILQYADMNELRSAIAEKKVERLSYLGLKELSEYLKNHMDFELFPLLPELEQAALIVEYRNVIVHNHGVIGNTSVRRFPSLKAKSGERINLTHSKVKDDLEFLEQAILDIDVRATEKFKLPVMLRDLS